MKVELQDLGSHIRVIAELILMKDEDKQLFRQVKLCKLNTGKEWDAKTKNLLIIDTIKRSVDGILEDLKYQVENNSGSDCFGNHINFDENYTIKFQHGDGF